MHRHGGFALGCRFGLGSVLCTHRGTGQYARYYQRVLSADMKWKETPATASLLEDKTYMSGTVQYSTNRIIFQEIFKQSICIDANMKNSRACVRPETEPCESGCRDSAPLTSFKSLEEKI